MSAAINDHMLRPPPRSQRSQSRIARVGTDGGQHPLSRNNSENGEDERQSHVGSSIRSLSPSHRAECDLGLRSPASGLNSPQLGDTEVYVHRVNKSDTLPKIILQYRIPMNVLRRANRMFASDSIQFRDTLLLPVAACEVAAKPIEENLTPLVETSEIIKVSSYLNNHARVSVASFTASDRDVSSPVGSIDYTKISKTRRKQENRSPKRELDVVRRVMIEGIGMVDVARVPASSLSYFPPSKHNNKSNPSDLMRNSFDQYRDATENATSERGSFESLRIGAGKVAADAFNGTQGLIRRLKERKNTSEIDLIEL